VATLVICGTDAEAGLPDLRDALGPAGSASLVRPGVVVARAVAPDSYLLRRVLVPAIEGVAGAAVPKVWRL
jgi:urease accessory protein